MPLACCLKKFDKQACRELKYPGYMVEGRNGRQQDEETRQELIDRLKQGAKNLIIHTKAMDNAVAKGKPPLPFLRGASEAQQQFEQAAYELKENPYKPRSKEWNTWNREHYLKPARRRFEQEQKKRRP